MFLCLWPLLLLLKKKKVVIIKDITDKVNQVMVSKYTNVYDIQTCSSTLQYKPDYRIVYASLPNSQTKFTVFDKNFEIERGFNELCFKRIGSNKVKDMLSKNNVIIEGELVEPTLPFDVKEEIEKIGWDRLIRYISDDTDSKDKRIIDLFLSFYVNCPRQDINNHAIILTNPGTGKSHTCERMFGEEPTTDVSVPGLLGTAQHHKDNWIVIPGALDGKGVAFFDEFPDNDRAIVHRLLNYLANGEEKRAIVTDVKCKGTKTVVFMGNYSTLSDKDFKKSLVGLATSEALSRVSRRFAHIIYGWFETVKKKGEKQKKVDKYRIIITYALRKAEKKINSFFNFSSNWILEPDEEYVEVIENIRKGVGSDSIRAFLEGYKLHIPNLRASAIKRAIIGNLPLFLERTSCEKIYEQIKPEIDYFYNRFKQMNIDSAVNFQHRKKKRFHELVEKGKSVEEICKEIQISEVTYYAWVNE